jgi:preprotein translocase subunit YajC
MMNMMILAEAAPAPQPQGGGFMIGWLVIMVAIFYFMIIRPQRKREKARKELISATKTGDRVLLTSGILGRVSNVKDKTFTVKIADGVKIEVVRSAVSQVLSPETDLNEAEVQQG